MAHFAGVGGIVAPDAEDAPHGKARFFAGNGNRGLAGGRKNEIGHEILPDDCGEEMAELTLRGKAPKRRSLEISF